MNAKLSRQMTLLGLGVLAFYAGLLGTGQASLELGVAQPGPQLGGCSSSGRHCRPFSGQAIQYDLQRVRPLSFAYGCDRHRLRNAHCPLKHVGSISAANL